MLFQDSTYAQRDDVAALMWLIVAVDRRVPTDERIPEDYVGAREALSQKLTRTQRDSAHQRARMLLDTLRFSFKQCGDRTDDRWSSGQFVRRNAWASLNAVENLEESQLAPFVQVHRWLG